MAAFARARCGAAGVEYMVLVSGIGVVLLVAIYLLGEDMSGYWNDLNDGIGGAGER